MFLASRDVLAELDSAFDSTTFKNDALSVINFFYVVIQFWDIKSKKPRNLFISCKETNNINSFLNRHHKEIMKNINEDRLPNQEGILHNNWAFIVIIVVALILLVVFL